MQFYLKPVGGTQCLFTILDHQGLPAYEASGKMTPSGCKILLLDEKRAVAGRISGVRFAQFALYSVHAGRNKVSAAVNYGSFRQPVRLRGKRWKFRGNLETHSFDIVNRHSQVVMVHGKCWKMPGDCYAVQIAGSENVPLCLCLAVLLDCAVSGGCAAPLLAGG
ncbi:MAG: hypothetical protein LKJ17_11550 [Oscillospiraceae bacterium]|nr:hypothetical protein [Oscillospiraceae bacterium]